MRSPVREVIPSSGVVWKWVVGGAPHAVDAENGGRRCEERLEEAFFRLGKLSRRSVAIARLLTFRFFMCISSRWTILFTY